MAQYIDKSDLETEIERLTEVKPIDEFQPQVQNKIDWLSGKLFVINSLRVFLDTIEVKDVDLDKEFDKYCENLYLIDLENEPYAELFECAKHFFELGLKVQKG